MNTTYEEIESGFAKEEKKYSLLILLMQ